MRTPKRRPRTSPHLKLVELSPDTLPSPPAAPRPRVPQVPPKFINTSLTAQFPFAPPLPTSPGSPPLTPATRYSSTGKFSADVPTTRDSKPARNSSSEDAALDRRQPGMIRRGVSQPGSMFGEIAPPEGHRDLPRFPRSPLRSVSPRRRPNTVGALSMSQETRPCSSPKRAPLAGFDPDVQERASLPALFKQKGALERLRPGTADTWREDDPGVSDGGGWQAKPQLVANLEAFLEEKLRIADKLAAGHGPRSGHSHAAANMALDAHRQTFEAFIAAFTTYRPLLQRVRAEYDAALNDGMRSVHDAVHMRAELAVQEQRMARAVEDAQMDANAVAASMRAEMYSRLLQTEERAAAADAAAAAAEVELKVAQGQLRTAKDDAETLKDDIRELREAMVAASTWGTEISAA